jgi:MFS family permease
METLNGGSPLEAEPLCTPSKRSLRGLDWFTFFLGDMQSGFGPFMAVYLVTQKWNQSEIGLVFSIGAIASLLFQIPGGAIIDWVRSERSAAAGSIAAICVAAFTIALLPVFAAVAFARILQAGASALLGPAVGAITLGLVGRRTLAARLGRNARFASAGNGVAAIVMGSLGHYLPPQAVFFVTAGFAIPALTALFQIREQDVNPAAAHGGIAKHEKSGVFRGLAGLARRRGFLIFLGILAFFQAANAPMLPLAASELTSKSAGWAITLVAACIVLPQILVALVSPWVGSLAQSVGRRPLLLAALGVLPLRGLLFAYVSDPSVIVAVQLLDGVSAAVLGVLIPLIVADVTYGTGHFNLGQGAAGMAIGLAAAIGTSAAGFLADGFGIHVTFIGLAVIAACGFALAFFMPETGPAEPMPEPPLAEGAGRPA